MAGLLMPTTNGSAGGFDDPMTLGLLGIASSLLQASGRSRVPIGLGQALGMGIQGGLLGIAQGKKAQKEQRERDDKLRTLPLGLFTGNPTWTRR